MILLDTNILIEYFKGDKSIRKTLIEARFENLAASSVTVMELFYGARNKKELVYIKKALAELHTVHLSTSISALSMQLIEKYSKSHNLDIPDALIAATAIDNSMELYTLNKKDFKYISELTLYKF